MVRRRLDRIRDMSVWIKYALPVVISLIAALGIYYSGYVAGKRNAELKVVKETVEVVKYVEKQKAQIHSQPNIGRDGALRLLNNNIL